jgi:hypothetical protein
MGLLQFTTATLALLGSALAAPTSEIVERSAADKSCDAASKICYTEYVANGISFRIAIPDSAKAGSPFDILLSITAPKATGWAGIAWGGAMANNPLTVGWSNAATAVVSSRRATGHTMPTAYTGATYTTLPSTTTNATHWKLDVVCTGCSSWSDASSKAVNLDPSSSSVTFAYASSANAPAEPANPASRFGIHNAKGKWTHDLSAAKIANFDSLVKAAEAAKPATL